MDSLVLTLGHNSSAILIRDNAIVAGFEEERLSGIKSDSHFPEKSIGQLIKLHGLIEPTIFVSHWELFGQVNAMNKKHWDQEYIQRTFGKPKIFETNDEFTHHDAHAWSAILFAEPFPCDIADKTMIFVMDGFGTFGEHMSFYKYVDGIPHLVSRKFGFGSSLGLLYQYTTAFLGMKQNQDEYKLLAYEAHIGQVSVSEKLLNDCIDVYTEKYLTSLASYQLADKTDPMLSIGALPTYAAEVANMLSSVLKIVQNDGPEFSEKERRIIIAHFTQSVVERVVHYFIGEYEPKNLILVGGLFYNVKLNNMISNNIEGKTCIMPLAGDQGAGLGLYKAMHSGFNWPGHLYWGTRTLEEDQFKGIDGIVYATKNTSCEELTQGWIHEFIKNGRIINIVRGSMEFGPRALCHTSTLALPNPIIANEINRVNNRVNEMPFAPVMNQNQAQLLLQDTDKIHKSLEYMICTRDLKPGAIDNLRGAAHKYPKSTKYSARPQITSDPFIGELVQSFGPLINTSFNYHGVPIVYNADQIKHTHAMEQSHESEYPPVTVVIGE